MLFSPDLNRTIHSTSALDDGWVKDNPGVEYSLLHVDKPQGLWVTRTRFSPGVLMPYHLHTGLVIGLTTRGCWGYPENERWFTTGEYCVEPAGTYHEVKVPDTNQEITEVVFLMWGALITFSNDGKTIEEYTDASTIENEYLNLCAQQNIQPTKYIKIIS